MSNDDPVEEVYRIREEILNEFGGIKEYHAYLRKTRPELEAMGFKFLTETECEMLKNRH